ncbi:MAG: Uncharacterised protein [Glaciecola sp. HTCC2999]|jgi:hypothetical protein|nr:MAG: Uncharacterised protein [Glaciecola sp. HTCC2999]
MKTSKKKTYVIVSILACAITAGMFAHDALNSSDIKYESCELPRHIIDSFVTVNGGGFIVVDIEHQRDKVWNKISVRSI